MQAYYADYASESERRKDEMRHAERHRLARSVSSQESRLAGAYRHLFSSLGGLMVSWGCLLQSRFVEA
jgi:hypothetical protein